MFMEINKNSEKVTALKTEIVLGRDTKTPTLPKSVSISVPGPSSGTTSTSKKQLLFMSPFFPLIKINYRENHSLR